MNFIRSFLETPEGGAGSFKRLAALVCFVVAIVATFTGKDLGTVSLWLGTGAGLLGLGALTKS